MLSASTRRGAFYMRPWLCAAMSNARGGYGIRPYDGGGDARHRPGQTTAAVGCLRASTARPYDLRFPSCPLGSGRLHTSAMPSARASATLKVSPPLLAKSSCSPCKSSRPCSRCPRPVQAERCPAAEKSSPGPCGGWQRTARSRSTAAWRPASQSPGLKRTAPRRRCRPSSPPRRSGRRPGSAAAASGM